MKKRLPILIIAGIFLLAACAPATTPAPTTDVNLVKTSAASTVVAEFTLVAASWTLTPVPPTEAPTTEPPTLEIPSATPTLPLVIGLTDFALGTTGPLCDDLSFDSATVDVNYPDGTQMAPSQDFTKTWKIKNTGTCAWGAGYSLTYANYVDKMSGVPVPLNTVVATGQEVDVSVNFKAPAKIGEYLSAWQMTNPQSIPFGKALFVKIIVR